MTRNTPGSDGYQPGSPYGQPPQSQYGQPAPSYGNFPPGLDYQPSTYGGEQQGSAQGYYGSNDKPYAEYPHDRPPPSENYYQGPPESSYPPQPPQYSQHQYGGQPPYQHYDQRQQYGSPQPGYAQPQYNQGYPAAPQQWDQQYPGPNMPPPGHSGAPPGQYPPSQYPPAQYPSGQYPPGPGQTDEERGIMGAIAGGAAGAYGGHKMNHGILGGIGGAVAGSMLEDAYKKKNKKEKKPKKSRRGSHSSSSSSSSSSSDSDSSKKKKKKHGGGGRAMAGNFNASSRSVRLEGRSMLVAECADKRGLRRRAALDLNDCFTNRNGDLLWSKGGNFAASAKNIKVSDNGKVMECELGDGRGGWKYAWVMLDERITNQDGQLRML